ncbi:MAG TPA: LysM peptidoglycan-binding domain-containing protein [Candidatus Acidoferrales bacterium]|jgi:membrane-bound lytic murein transglycosylase D|nr:LysM peptidoglycan-binding domain-containing protein [Candidatus Acidoferrales bacterium]
MGKRAQKSAAWIFVAAGVLVNLAGCEDTSKKQVQVKPPQITLPVQQPVQAAAPVAPQPKVAPPVAMPVPVGPEQVAAESQAAFDAGEQDFKAGHLGKARAEFDDALDHLLASGFDLDSDARLSGLYHHIIDTVSLDELEAFRAGDGFSEQKSTPAPIDEIADQPIPQPEVFDPNLRGRAEGEVGAIDHDLPLTVNDPVLAYLNYFKTPRGSAIVETGLRRAGRYREMVRRVLKEEGIPQDLIYLAQAESAFLPQAVSKAGARGMWQFMSFAGRKYGLQKTWWVDERQDPEKATRAAARDLRDLYDQFGDWYLAMAAYNSGAGAVQHAVERTGYADFWELYHRNVLPKETMNYVPIIVALTLISKDPARYGIEFEPEPALKADKVKPGQAIDLRLVAETIDTDLESLRSMNPELLRLVTPADPDFVLQIPEGSAERFFAEIAAIPPEKWVSWRRHKVEQGETLSSIAKQYRVSTAEVADANDLAVGTQLEEGQKLIIPAAARTETSTGKLIRYRVRRTDTISTIADEFDVTTAELRKWNHIKADHVVRGTSLRIYPGGMTPGPSQQEASNRTKSTTTSAVTPVVARTSTTVRTPIMEARSNSSVVHRVKQGETLWSIARAYQTTVEAIQAGNRYLFSRPLQVGDTLTILQAH